MMYVLCRLDKAEFVVSVINQNIIQKNSIFCIPNPTFTYLSSIRSPQCSLQLRLTFLPLTIYFPTPTFFTHCLFPNCLTSFKSGNGNGTLEFYPCVVL